MWALLRLNICEIILHTQCFQDHPTANVERCEREVAKVALYRIYHDFSTNPLDLQLIPTVRSAGIIASVLRLGPALLRLVAQFPHGCLLQPIRLPLHSPDRKVVLSTFTLEHARPAVNRSLNLLLRQANNLLPQLLLLRRDALRIHVRDIHRDVRPLGAAQVGRRVLGEAARDEGARAVLAREDVVAAARPVDAAAGRDVVDGAIEGHVDGFVRVGAVVGEELGVGQGDGTLL
jgi:hypothetical protein